MKPRRTSLPSDAARASVRVPAAPTASVDAGPSASAALRERLMQARARIARAQAQKAPQINVDWDPEELPTRHYKGEPLIPPWRQAQRAWYGNEPPAQPRTRLGSGEVLVHRDAPAPAPPRGRARSGEVSIGTNTRTQTAESDEAAQALVGNEAFSEATNGWPSAHDALDPEAFPNGEGEVHTQAAHEPQARARARSGEMLIGARFGEPTYVEMNASDALDPAAFPGAVPRRRVRELLAEPEHAVSPHIAPISERPTHAPLAIVVRRELTALREHLQALYARLDSSEQTLRNRVALCSGGLLLAAALSVLFSHNQSPQTHSAPNAAMAPRHAALPGNASVTISSDPAGAEIFLDGRASGKVTPASIAALTPGKHRIGLQLAGYRETSEALHLPEDGLLSIRLAPLNQPRPATQTIEPRPQTAAEARAQARARAREHRAALRAAKAMSRYRSRMGLSVDAAPQER